MDDTSGGAPARTTAYGYNANGSLATVTLPNTVVHNYGYDALNRLRTLNVAKGVASLHSYEYKLRASGHRQQVIENGTRTSTFGYDSLYRLTSETLTGDTRGNNGSVSYGLDKVGNRESRTSSVPAVSTAAHTFNSRDWLNTDVYDANGNTLTSSFSSVSVPDVYDFEDRLIIRYKPDGSTVNLSYDADGILRQKAVFNFSATLVSATGYMTDTQNPTGYAQVLEERVNLASGTTVKVYAYGSDLISQSTLAPGASLSVLRYYAYDGLMSVRELTDANGLVTDSYDYDAFGIRIYGVGSTVNDYLYRGERFDSDIGQYSLRARFYNQATGRFWNQDTYEGSTSDPMSLHKYLYAHGNPVMNWDPSGNKTLGEVIGAATLAIRFQLALIVPSIAAGGAAIGRVWNQLGVQVQNAAQNVMMLFPRLNVATQVPLANRIIDFSLRARNQVALLETKYKLPAQIGESMTRLVGQLNTAVAARQGQVVIWTYKEPTLAELQLLYQQLGAQAARVQVVHGLQGLYNWIQFYFRIEGSG